VDGRRHRRRALVALLAAALLAACSPPGSEAPPQAASPTQAELGHRGELDLAALGTGSPPLSAEIEPATEHRYRLRLPADHFLRLSVEQHGVDVAVSLETVAGNLVADADHPVADRAPELLLADSGEGGDRVLRIRAWEGPGPGRYEIRTEALRPATDHDRRAAAAYRELRAAHAIDKSRPEAAVDRWTRLLDVWRRLGEPELEGRTLVRLADFHAHRDPPRSAREYAAAAVAFAGAGDRRWEAVARTKAATELMAVDDVEGAVGQYEQAVGLAVSLGDAATESEARRGLGQAYRWQGELQPALDQYRQGLAGVAADDPERANLLSNLGALRARFLGDVEGGRELLLQARDAVGSPPEHRSIALQQLGQIALEADRLDEASESLRTALDLLGEEASCERSVNLARLALVEAARRPPRRHDAEELLDRARNELGGTSCERSATTVHRLAAEMAERLGDAESALAAYRRCGDMYAAQGDQEGRAVCLAGTARALHTLGDDTGALKESAAALAILQGVRPTVLRTDLRMSYFAARQELVDLHLRLLLDQGRAADAWVLAENARARVLGDLLREAAVGLRHGVDPALAERELELQRRLNALESGRLKTEDRVRRVELTRRLDAVVDELETVRGEIRRGGGETAAGPGAADVAPATVAELQAALPADALLLELRLGAEASTLWAVDRAAVIAYRLPSRSEIETAAREARAWLSGPRWPGFNPPPVCELSRLLLAPVASRLGARHVLVVADGELENVPFAALPEPSAAGDETSCPSASPLLVAHRVSYLPSAATLLVQRRRLAHRRPAGGWLAVVADPVYQRSDPRLPRTGAGEADGAPRGPSPAGATDDFAGSAAGPDWRRLRHAGEEAADLLALVPPRRALAATGTGAGKKLVTGGGLGGYRVLHFATHGLLATDRPLLSHLALSTFDAAGRPVDGALHAHEIYDLDLDAELVVLSACDTALGRQVRGEGLVAGLPRAFLYAGAARVLVSLWAVEDRGTRDLMSLFYVALLQDGLSPPQALREAQGEMWRRGEPPYRWAGFELLGDPGPLPPFRP